MLKCNTPLAEPPGGTSPNACGNGVPLVVPSLAVVNTTLLAVVEPMFCTVMAAWTVEGVVRVNDDAKP